ncbi:hypothetical protein SNOG_05833 [Parastagonospora nodorum SN15]|uniref:Uncharacterized protein n=1 Tax=Phaeosphaeria nodorum (strain SN15 / ATCC MYA-4574 / FGSC 10173) TaxID=321614 RepID=Q0UQY1_PHANO|nr:hypothetical protein SNOG_05833 [Parastagonospora nodorum SN15]EAT86897.1 hypothetical protein SNOG_05833 [Parastagonospora nodorum SN15]
MTCDVSAEPRSFSFSSSWQRLHAHGIPSVSYIGPADNGSRTAKMLRLNADDAKADAAKRSYASAR